MCHQSVWECSTKVGFSNKRHGAKIAANILLSAWDRTDRRPQTQRTQEKAFGCVPPTKERNLENRTRCEVAMDCVSGPFFVVKLLGDLHSNGPQQQKPQRTSHLTASRCACGPHLCSRTRTVAREASQFIVSPLSRSSQSKPFSRNSVTDVWRNPETHGEMGRNGSRLPHGLLSAAL